jgi:riboflavin kinase / FMN adenylyltransferase
MPLAILRSPEEWIAQFGASREGTSLSIGNFDGVHLGHQKIIHALVEKARDCKLKSAVVTFDPHPAKVLKPGSAPTMLETVEQRCRHFADLGIDAVLILKFNEALSGVSAEDFVKRILVDSLRVREMFVGDNFRFGQKQRGDVQMLQAMGRNDGFAVNIVDPKTLDGQIVSSSAIRQALRDGRVTDAERMLGRPFALAGEIVSGTGIGRKVIVPTLNLKTAQETLPKNGVYVTQTTLDSGTYGSVTNIGIRPTFDGQKLAIESHLFGYSAFVTDGPMEVKFLQRLREEQKFTGPEALRAQVLHDIERAQALYSELQAK